MKTLLAYELGWRQCHVCEECDFVWDVEKLPPRTSVH